MIIYARNFSFMVRQCYLCPSRRRDEDSNDFGFCHLIHSLFDNFISIVRGFIALFQADGKQSFDLASPFNDFWK